MSRVEVVDPRAHGAIEPFHGSAAESIRFRLIDAMRIVDDYNIGTFASGRTAYRGRDATTGTIIFEPLLLILIWTQLINVPPRVPGTTRIQSAAGTAHYPAR
jgi:hypothetical protein